MEEANQLLRDAALTNKVMLEIEFDVAGWYIQVDTINLQDETIKQFICIHYMAKCIWTPNLFDTSVS